MLPARRPPQPRSDRVRGQRRGRWRPYSCEEILARDKVSLDVFWLRDETLEDSANLPDPHVLAEEIAEDLRASLEQIESVLVDLQQGAAVRSE